MEDYALAVPRRRRDPRDEAAWQEVRDALPSLGYVLTTRGIRRHTAPLDRVALAPGGGRPVPGDDADSHDLDLTEHRATIAAALLRVQGR